MLKIAFLFLTITNVYHEDYWHDFFRGHEDQYSIYVHAKETVTHNSWFKPYEMHEKVPTTWANTMRAQIAMLKEALSDPLNEKFVFVSETTIPLRTFDYVFEQLMSTHCSIFHYMPNPYVNRNVSQQYCAIKFRNYQPIPVKDQFKNAQWVILSRKHAQMMVDDTYYLEIIASQPHDQEHYPSTFLLNNNCLHEIIPQDMTYVEWHVPMPKYPYTFSNLRNEKEMDLLKKAHERGYLFARKIAKECDLKPLDPLLEYRKYREQPDLAFSYKEPRYHA